VVGVPVVGCSDGEPDFTEGAGEAGEASGATAGNGNGGSAQHAGSAGKGVSGGTDGGVAGSMSLGGAGSPGMAGESMGGTSLAGEGGIGQGGIGAEGGIGGEGGEGGASDASCPSGSYALVGATGCFECPGPMYVTFPSTCAMLGDNDRYDPATHQVRLEAGEGLPMPSAWSSLVETTFDTPQHKSACTAHVGYSVDRLDYIADLDALSACVGIKDITLWDLHASYDCSAGVTSSTYIYVDFAQGAQAILADCQSPFQDVPIMFGSHVPFPHPPRFDVSTPSAVKDNETGLTWEQRAAGDYPSLSEPASATHCSALSHAGFDDWRLPTANELFTLVKLESNGTVNHHDSTIFPNSPAVAFWTSSPSTNIGAGTGFAIDFGSFYVNIGQIVPPVPLQNGFPQTQEHRVRCVRGGASPAQRYTSNANGTVSDNVTGYVWEKKPTRGDDSAVGAQAYCRDLALAGGGWHVPTVRELSSILQLEKSSAPFLDPVFEAAAGSSTIYWSSSPFFAENHVGWTVDFAWGAQGPAGDDPAQASVRCVR